MLIADGENIEMTLERLLAPVRIGGVIARNSVVMAPLTRSRSGQPGDVPTDLNALYYAQRASAGLIISEATQISREAQGYALSPGIYTDAQEEGWRLVLSEVKRTGGLMALQLWHAGRASHRSLQPDGAPPVAPSAVRAEGVNTFIIGEDGVGRLVPVDQPRELAIAEIPMIVEQYVNAARRAADVGFDFVEIHAANGYLLHQFMSAKTNFRGDRYGGSILNRARLTIEVVQAVSDAVGAEQVGLRFSPNFVGQGMHDSGSEDIALFVAKELSAIGIGYFHLAEPHWLGAEPLTDDFRRELRSAFTGSLIACGSYTAIQAEERLQSGMADAIAFGRPFIANPDLVERMRLGAPLNVADHSTFYGGGAKGYTDWPTIDGTV